MGVMIDLMMPSGIVPESRERRHIICRGVESDSAQCLRRYDGKLSCPGADEGLIFFRT